MKKQPAHWIAIPIAASIMLAAMAYVQPSMARKPAAAIMTSTPENGLGGLTGKITGDLLPAGKVVVTLIQEDKVIDRTETDDEGFYKFRYVAEGSYELKATKDGYRTCIVTAIPIAPDRVTKLDFYASKINNDHMDDSPIVEPYEYYRKYMKHPNISYPR